MKKIDEILNNKNYMNYIKKLEHLENDRIFCKHDVEHFLSTSRIAYIINLEESLGYSKEVIYAIGLLHDIGRVLEYERNIPHDEASVIIAKEILKETSFTKDEVDIILNVISEHRVDNSTEKISEIIYKSDKLSRNCFNCKAERECYWSKNKKNFNIKY